MEKKFIPVSEPYIDEIETKFVNDAMNKKAISGFFGEYISKFEEGFAKYSDCKYGVAVTSGTTALHLAMLAIDLKPGDEVLVSTLTNMATEFSILYQGAKPIPIDIEEDTLNIDPRLIEAKITPKTKAILVVHLFGHPVDMDPINKIAKKHKLFVVEDCAEAHGATYNGKKVGSLGHIGCLSFYANKIITTGEGGMITTNDKKLAEKAKAIKSLAFGDKFKFMHTAIGYNYRMTNVQAAIGYGQLGKIEDIIKKKREMAAYYTENLRNNQDLQLPIEKPYARNVYWMYHLALKNKLASKRGVIMKKLMDHGIEVREGFIPYNMQDIFVKQGLTNSDECPIANKFAYSSFYLPSGPSLTKEDMKYVVDKFNMVLKSV